MTPKCYFKSSIVLWLASLVSGWTLWAVNGPSLLAVVPCLLITAASVAMIVAIDLHEKQST